MPVFPGIPDYQFLSVLPEISLLLLVTSMKAHHSRYHVLYMVVSHCSFATIPSPSQRLRSRGRIVSGRSGSGTAGAVFLAAVCLLRKRNGDIVLTPLGLSILVVKLLDLLPEFAYRGPSFLMDPCSKSEPFDQVWSLFEELALEVLDLFYFYFLFLMKWRSVRLITEDLKNDSSIYYESSGNARIVIKRIYAPPVELQDNPILEDIYVDTPRLRIHFPFR
jgi:hypothetical protein